MEISTAQEIRITELLDECLIVSPNNSIKQKYVELRKKYHLKISGHLNSGNSNIIKHSFYNFR